MLFICVPDLKTIFNKLTCMCCITVVVHSLSSVRFFATPWTGAHQTSLSSPSPGVCSNSCLLSWWCRPTNSSSVVPFSSCLQSFPASGSFPMSSIFALGGQSIGDLASASASVFPRNIQGWFPLGSTGLISLLSKGLSRVFSCTTIQKHYFFSPQLKGLIVVKLRDLKHLKNHGA